MESGARVVDDLRRRTGDHDGIRRADEGFELAEFHL
jgi:hypothetical protein